MTSIVDFLGKIKPFLEDLKNKAINTQNSLKIKEDIFIVIIIVFVGLTSFGLGKLSAVEKERDQVATVLDNQSLKVEGEVAIAPTLVQSKAKIATIITTNTSGPLVASKNGTRYYYPNCSGVSRIKQENKIWFQSIAEAEAKGLTLASNCTSAK